jgi:hypothetical protein
MTKEQLVNGLADELSRQALNTLRGYFSYIDNNYVCFIESEIDLKELANAILRLESEHNFREHFGAE